MPAFPIDVTALEPWGTGLRRPECVVAVSSGAVYVPHSPGGVTRIGADGDQQDWLTNGLLHPFCPNGIDVNPDGSFLVANLGDDGGVWRFGRDGTLSPVLIALGSLRVPPANFVTTDAKGRTWVSVSTDHVPRHGAWRRDVRDGFIVRIDRRGARVVADSLHYTNEVRPDPSGRWLYAVETFGRRLSRFPIGPDGDLGRRETVVTLPEHGFPDGFAFDEDGGIWITTLISNRLYRFHHDELTVVLEEPNAAFIAAAESAFATDTMTAAHLGPIPGTRLQHLTSIAFGGADRRIAYLGSLHAACLYRFQAPVAGAALASWHGR